MFEFIKNVLIKPTRSCNLNCEYCHLLDKAKYKNELMDFELYKKIVDKIVIDRARLQIRTQEKLPSLSFVLHGGEPTLLGTKNLFKFYEYAYHEFRKNNLLCVFGIQTNGSLIDDDMAEVLRKFNVSIGLSYDGPGDSNKLRTPLNYSKILKFFKQQKLFFGTITCVSESNKHQMKKIVKSKNTKISKVIDVTNSGKNLEIPSGDMFYYVYKPAIDYYIKTGEIHDRSSYIFLYKTIQSIFLNKNEKKVDTDDGICDLKYCGAGVGVLSINPDGTLQFCGRDPSLPIGHSLDCDFLGISLKKQNLQFLQKRVVAVKEKGCDTCYLDGVCRYWCPAFSKILFDDFSHLPRNDMCEEYKLFYKYIIKHLEKILLRAAKSELSIPISPYYSGNLKHKMEKFLPPNVYLSVEQNCLKIKTEKKGRKNV